MKNINSPATQIEGSRRQIKFRIWDENLKKFFYQKDDLYLGYIFNYFSNPNSSVTKKTIIQQFTDVIDKNGCEIYEGDLMSYWERTGVRESDWRNYPVVFRNGTFCLEGEWNYWQKSKEYHSVVANADGPYEGEVVGNIFENKKNK